MDRICDPAVTVMRIGVDLGGTKIEIAALDAGGRIVLRQRFASPLADYDATVRAVRDGVLKAEVDLGATCSVGLGIPGTISPATGLVKNANSTWLNGKPFDVDIAEALNRPIRMANDANCFALSEAADGAGKDKRVVFGAILGTGVGGGIAVDARILTGPNAIAGEWGHNPLPWADFRRKTRPTVFLRQTRLHRDVAQRARPGGGFRTRHGPPIHHRGNCGRRGPRRCRGRSRLDTLRDAPGEGTGSSRQHPRSRHHRSWWRPFQSRSSVYERFPADRTLRVLRYGKTPSSATHNGESSGVRGAAWLWPEPAS